MYGTASAVPRDSASADAWDRAFRDEYGEGTESSYVRESYDAAVAVMLAAEAAGSAAGASIRDELRRVGSAPGERVLPGPEGVVRAMEIIRDGGDVDYEGAANSVDWDANGDLERGYIGIWRFTRDGEVEDVETIPVRALSCRPPPVRHTRTSPTATTARPPARHHHPSHGRPPADPGAPRQPRTSTPGVVAGRSSRRVALSRHPVIAPPPRGA